MNCCSCKKEVDITKHEIVNEIEATWYGKYHMDKCTKVICRECIKDKGKKESFIK